MIRVMHVISDTNIGGAGRALINYLRYYDRDRYELSVVLPRGSELIPSIQSYGAWIYEVDGMADKSMDFGALRELKALIHKVDPDIVHTHGALTGRIAAKQCGKAAVFTRHSAFPFPAYVRKTPLKLLYKFLYEHYADRIIVISPAGAEVLREGGVSADKIDVMMNGVDPLPTPGGAEREALRARFGCEPSEFVLGILARIEEYKGHLTILEALRQLTEEERKVKLIIAGTGSFEDTLRERVKALELTDRVIFTGFVSRVAEVLGAMDLQLNASYVSETSSLSLLEGFSMGLPAVASDCCGNPWVVEDGVNGFLFPPRDARALARRVGEVMDLPDRGKALGEGARRIYEERFTARQFARHIEEIYTKVWEEKNHGKGK